MRFEPRIIRPDEPEEPLDLPADLAELAEQLTADAQWLAERHPGQLPSAQGPAPAPAAAVDRGRRLARAAAVAMLLFGVGLWGGKLWRGAMHVERPHVDAALATDNAGSRNSALEGNSALGSATARRRRFR